MNKTPISYRNIYKEYNSGLKYATVEDANNSIKELKLMKDQTKAKRLAEVMSKRALAKNKIKISNIFMNYYKPRKLQTGSFFDKVKQAVASPSMIFDAGKRFLGIDTHPEVKAQVRRYDLSKGTYSATNNTNRPSDMVIPFKNGQSPKGIVASNMDNLTFRKPSEYKDNQQGAYNVQNATYMGVGNSGSFYLGQLPNKDTAMVSPITKKHILTGARINPTNQGLELLDENKNPIYHNLEDNIGNVLMNNMQGKNPISYHSPKTGTAKELADSVNAYVERNHGKVNYYKTDAGRFRYFPFNPKGLTQQQTTSYYTQSPFMPGSSDPKIPAIGGHSINYHKNGGKINRLNTMKNKSYLQKSNRIYQIGGVGPKLGMGKRGDYPHLNDLYDKAQKTYNDAISSGDINLAKEAYRLKAEYNRLSKLPVEKPFVKKTFSVLPIAENPLDIRKNLTLAPVNTQRVAVFPNEAERFTNEKTDTGYNNFAEKRNVFGNISRRYTGRTTVPKEKGDWRDIVNIKKHGGIVKSYLLK